MYDVGKTTVIVLQDGGKSLTICLQSLRRSTDKWYDPDRPIANNFTRWSN